MIIYCADSSKRILKENRITDKRTINLLALRGGSESFQIVLFDEIKTHIDIQLEDLRSKENNVFLKDNFTIYFEKYIYVDKNWQKNGFKTGYYPDALIPYDSKVFRGENITGDGNNGIFIDIMVPLKQEPGIYEGAVKINEEKVLLKLEILSSIQPQEITHKSIFTINGEHMRHYEGECSEKMVKAYNDVLFKHHICSAIPSSNGKNSWAIEALNYIKSGASTVNIPSKYANEKHELFGSIPDYNELYSILDEVKKISVLKHINLFKYLVYYDWMIDEPFYCNYPDGKVEYHINMFNETIDKYVNGIKANDSFELELKESIKNIPHIVTDYRKRSNPSMRDIYDSNQKLYSYDNSVTLCPKFDGYDSVEQRELYSVQKEEWWYGCNTPNAPYPGYHLDDAGYSARIIGWLMALYGITGNLYWCINFFKECNTTGEMIFYDDPYLLAHMGTGANLDGALLYPGKPYEIFGPITSLRLKSIRSGYEEYEIIKLLKREYEKNGIDFEILLNSLTSEFIDGVKIDPYYSDFISIRNKILKMYDECLTNNHLSLTKEINKKIKIVPHEELYDKFVFTVKEGKIDINRDDIRREIIISSSNESEEVYIDLSKIDEEYFNYQKIDLLIRTAENAEYSIHLSGQYISGGKTTIGWNRINILNLKPLSPMITIRFSKGKELGFGEMYIFKAN